MVRSLLQVAVVICALSWLPAAAQESTIRQFDIPTLEKLGHDMFAQDQAAWQATDALMALHPQVDLLKENVRGWIVEDRSGDQLVRFIRTGDGGPRAAYDITVVSGSKPVVSVPSDRNLTDSEKAQYAARDLAIKNIAQSCGDNYNTVVLKDPEGDGWLAWALAATTKPGLMMAGGHYRLTVTPDGTQAVRVDALSRSCVALQTGPASDGRVPAAMFTTQLVSNLPVESFVFLSLGQNLPIFVMTPDRSVWRIADGKITKLDAAGPK